MSLEEQSSGEEVMLLQQVDGNGSSPAVTFDVETDSAGMPINK